MNPTRGVVYLIGAGPGDPGLMTVRGLQILRRADVVLHDRLVSRTILARCPRGARLINVGKTPGRTGRKQADINALLVASARENRIVVRLKGGDPFVFGRGYEELEFCRAAGVDCIAIPGVSSAVGVPASAGVPVTHRNVARSFAVVTGRIDATNLPPHEYAALAKIDTLCLLMGRSNLQELADSLIAAGRDPLTPAAAVASGTTPDEQVITGTLGTIADRTRHLPPKAPVTTVIGPTAAFAHQQAIRTASRPTPRRLVGRRVILTRAVTADDELRRRLLDEGATLVEVPLIEIGYAMLGSAADGALLKLDQYDWIALTSVHAVRGFWRRITQVGLDARALGRARVAAVGPGTARALRQRGIRADLVPDRPGGAGLVAALRRSVDLTGKRVLLAQGRGALPTIETGLRDINAKVHAMAVYETRPAILSDDDIDALRRGGDTIIFCSPSAVDAYAALKLGPPAANVACNGPTTAAAAARAGFAVGIIPEPPGTAGLVEALADHFALEEEAA